MKLEKSRVTVIQEAVEVLNKTEKIMLPRQVAVEAVMVKEKKKKVFCKPN